MNVHSAPGDTSGSTQIIKFGDAKERIKCPFFVVIQRPLLGGGMFVVLKAFACC